MSRKITSLLLVFALAFSVCMLPVTSVAESTAPTVIDPDLDIDLYTVPMRASVVILYAIRSSSVPSTDGLRLVVTKGESSCDVLPAGRTVIDGEEYVVFEYKGLSAAEMRTEVSAYICCGEARGNSVEYSVADFAEAYAASGGRYVDLVSSMLEYGDAVAELLS